MSQLRQILSMLLQALSFVVFLVLPFQNCTPAKFGPSSEFTSQPGSVPTIGPSIPQVVGPINSMGPGEGYTGKPDKFQYFDANRACSDRNRLGQPLPNGQIFWQYDALAGSNKPFLVRDRCRDIDPVRVLETDLVFPSGVNDRFTYLGQSFSSSNPPGDFDVVATACPPGKSLIAGATRRNLMLSADDWTRTLSSQGWWPNAGVQTSLFGTINSLPSFSVKYNSAVANDDVGAAQVMTLQPNTQYTLSFLARAGSVGNVIARLSRFVDATTQVDNASANFDLRNGTTLIAIQIAAGYAMTPVANGYLCTFYFTTTPQGDQGEWRIRIAPSGNMGDTVIVGHALLERVNDFCQ